MTSKTRNFVVASTMVLGAGLGTGLLAYYVGFPTGAASRSGPEDLQFIPATATLVASADVHTIMTSPLRERLRALVPTPHGQADFAAQTGINIDTDLDRITAALTPSVGSARSLEALMVARGRFDVVKIEALMREHGCRVEEVSGKRLLIAEGAEGKHPVSLAFMAPGLIVFGSASQVRAALALSQAGANVTTNDEVMNLVRDLDSSTAWAVGRFDALTASATLPPVVSDHLPPVQWFSANIFVDGGVRGTIRVETRDDASANSLRDIVRGGLALARLQSSRYPLAQTALDALTLEGGGRNVSLSFDVPVELFDELTTMSQGARRNTPTIQ